MTTEFKSDGQEKLFKAVLANLRHLGYQGELLQQGYSFIDWFQSDNPERIVPAAAFGQTPQSYDSACFAVVLSNGRCGQELIYDTRALGAPYALEVREDVVINWRVGRDLRSSKELLRITPNIIDRAFEDHRDNWTGVDVLRTKGTSFKLGPRQLDFIDLGLIPALEQQVSAKLDRLFREIIQDADALLKHQPAQLHLQGLYRLIFRFLAGKVLHDRGVPPFNRFAEDTRWTDVLHAVGKYYGEQQAVPSDPALQDLVASTIWTKLDFRNLSVEVLAYIYENTLVDPAIRKGLGTHSTPHSIARYIVHQIPYEKLEQDQRHTLEPFCGHGIFLVAALQRLRELLPPTMDSKERHRYFVRMLRGFEIDQFALEVSRLCLMLADFPNHNGWKLNDDDVFKSEVFATAVRQSQVILSNPPFEDFTDIERKRYPSLSSVQKPVEFLSRVFASLPPNGMLGVVLPRQFLDGRGYRDIRDEVYKRFQEVQLTTLPDGIFDNADMETALLIATEPRDQEKRKLRVSFCQVAEADRSRFLTEYGCTRRDEAEKNATETGRSLNVVQLQEIWDRLTTFPRLGQQAEIHRGVEWQAPFEESRLISTEPRHGFRRGLFQAKRLQAYEIPESYYLSVQPEFRLYDAFELPWEKPKVFVNAARVSRGPWAMAAFTDSSGLLSTQNFHGIWPEHPWTIGALVAVLNAPLANAFVAVHEFKRHIRKQTIQALPLPNWGPEQMGVAEQLVAAYQKSVAAGISIADAEKTLLAIDAFVLKGYALPPRMERQLLDIFQGVARPVPFKFQGYFPPGFVPTIPLWMYLSEDFQKCSARYLLSKVPRITDPALIAAFEEVAE